MHLIAQWRMARRPVPPNATHENHRKRMAARLLFEKSPDAYLTVCEGVFTDCNDAALAMLGGTREQVIGQQPDISAPEHNRTGRCERPSAPRRISRRRCVRARHVSSGCIVAWDERAHSGRRCRSRPWPLARRPWWRRATTSRSANGRRSERGCRRGSSARCSIPFRPGVLQGSQRRLLGLQPPFAELAGRSQDELVGKTTTTASAVSLRTSCANDRRVMELEPRRGRKWIASADSRRR